MKLLQKHCKPTFRLKAVAWLVFPGGSPNLKRLGSGFGMIEAAFKCSLSCAQYLWYVHTIIHLCINTYILSILRTTHNYFSSLPEQKRLQALLVYKEVTWKKIQGWLRWTPIGWSGAQPSLLLCWYVGWCQNLMCAFTQRVQECPQVQKPPKCRNSLGAGASTCRNPLSAGIPEEEESPSAGMF